jgi:D-alanyl-D-alanine carboxypeptidase
VPVDALGPAIRVFFEALRETAAAARPDARPDPAPQEARPDPAPQDARRDPAPQEARQDPALRQRLQAKFEELHAAGKFPGGTAGFALPGGASFGIAVGVADRSTRQPMRPADRLLLGSVGKTYASAVALQLVHEGKVGLDDPISKYLGKEPWFRRLPNAGRITVRHLMTHTSGLVRYELDPRFTADLSANPDKVWSGEDRLAYLFDARPPFAPGEGWEYSDTNYIVLGLIIERAGGASYYEQLRRRILVPHGLDDTVPADSRTVPGLVQGYAGANNPFGGSDEMIVDGRFAVNPQFEWTGGGLAVTARDLARWAKRLYEGKVVDASLMDDLLDGVPAKLGPETKYGLGVIIRPTALGTTYGHSGFMPGYQTDVMYFPELKTAIAVQVNSSAPRSTGRPLRAFLVEFAAIVKAAGVLEPAAADRQ